MLATRTPADLARHYDSLLGYYPTTADRDEHPAGRWTLPPTLPEPGVPVLIRDRARRHVMHVMLFNDETCDFRSVSGVRNYPVRLVEWMYVPEERA